MPGLGVDMRASVWNRRRSTESVTPSCYCISSEKTVHNAQSLFQYDD